MNERCDKNPVALSFSEGDKVLVLLPIEGHPLQARFSEPYVIDKKLRETNCCSNSRSPAENMLVPHKHAEVVSREEDGESKSSVITPVASAVAISDNDADEDVHSRWFEFA